LDGVNNRAVLNVEGVRVLVAGPGATISEGLFAKNLLVSAGNKGLGLYGALAERFGAESIRMAVLFQRCVLDGLVVRNH